MVLNLPEPRADLRVCLDFTGCLTQGAHVTLTIARDGRTERRISIGLPPLLELTAQTHEHWQAYRQLAKSQEQRARVRLVEVFYEKNYATQLQACHESGDVLLEQFHQWLESDEMQQVVTQIRTYLSPHDRARLSIVATDRQVERLPWQKWSLLNDYPALEPALSFPHLSKCPQPRDRGRSTARILAVFGNGDGIDTSVDRGLLESAALDVGSALELEFEFAPTRAELEDALHSGHWDILFFAGHSRTEADSGHIFINATESVTIDELWYSLQKAADRGLRLAIFYSCDGLGIARGLNTARIPQMAIMREAVPDRVAQEFLRYFLQAFARDKLPLAAAVRHARQRLAHLESDHPCATWLPVLYQHPEADVLTWEQLVPQDAPQDAPSAIEPDPPKLTAPPASPAGPKTRRSLKLAAAAGTLALLWAGSIPLASQLGRSAYRVGNYALGARAFEVQSFLAPWDAVSRYNLAQVYDRKLRKPDRAIEMMRKSAMRGFAMAYPEWARLLLERDDFARADFAITEGLERLSPDSPNHTEIRASLNAQGAWLALQTGRLQKAERYAAQVIEVFPDSSAKAWCVRARVQAARQEDPREAWERVREQADSRLADQRDCEAEAEAYLAE